MVERFLLRTKRCAYGRHLSHWNAHQSLHQHQLLDDFQAISGTSYIFSFLQDVIWETYRWLFSLNTFNAKTVQYFLSLQEGMLCFQQRLGNINSHRFIYKTLSLQSTFPKFLVSTDHNQIPVFQLNLKFSFQGNLNWWGAGDTSCQWICLASFHWYQLFLVAVSISSLVWCSIEFAQEGWCSGGEYSSARSRWQLWTASTNFASSSLAFQSTTLTFCLSQVLCLLV